MQFRVPWADEDGRISPDALPPPPIHTLTGADETLAADHAGAMVAFTSDQAVTLTVNAGTLAAGERVDCAQRGDGAVTVVAAAGMTLNPMPGMSLVSEGKHAVWTILAHSDSDADVIGWMAPA